MNNISLIGIGKLGLCFALTLEKAGFNVLGCDISEDYVGLINDKTFESDEPGVDEMLQDSVNFKATTSLEAIMHHSNIIFVLVATPSLENGRYDHSQVDSVMTQLKAFGYQDENRQLVICCTTMPGYCDVIQESMGELNYTVSYNPEFIAQGTILRDQLSPDMVLIGEGSKTAGDVLQKIYEEHTNSNPRICLLYTSPSPRD